MSRMLIAVPFMTARRRGGRRRSSPRSMILGRSRKNTNTTVPTAAGRRLSRRLGSPPAPSPPAPIPTRPIPTRPRHAGEQGEAGDDEGDHVDCAREQKQHRRALGDATEGRTAFHEQPSSHRHAAHPAERDGGVERELGERHPGAEADRSALEDLEEGQHVPQAREDLEAHGGGHPPAVHPTHRVGDALEAGDGEKQADDQGDQDHEGDQAVEQPPAGLAAAASWLRVLRHR